MSCVPASPAPNTMIFTPDEPKNGDHCRAATTIERPPSTASRAKTAPQAIGVQRLPLTGNQRPA